LNNSKTTSRLACQLRIAIGFRIDAAPMFLSFSLPKSFAVWIGAKEI
jgi:hypothetical protein